MMTTDLYHTDPKLSFGPDSRSYRLYREMSIYWLRQKALVFPLKDLLHKPQALTSTFLLINTQDVEVGFCYQKGIDFLP